MVPRPLNRTARISLTKTFIIQHTKTKSAQTIASETSSLFDKQDIISLAYAPDDSLLLVAFGGRPENARRIALLLPREKYKIKREFNFDQDICAIAISPDGKTLAVAGGIVPVPFWDKQESPVRGTIVLWSIDTGDQVATLEGHSQQARCVAFSRGGRWLVTGAADRTVRIWETATGKEVLKLSGHEGPVTSVAFSSDGKVLATGIDDTTVLLWDVIKLLPAMSLEEKISLPQAPSLEQFGTDEKDGFVNGRFPVQWGIAIGAAVVLACLLLVAVRKRFKTHNMR